ncbi:MAG: ABC transporter substrate-binding protein [Lachnospiraceae bacterium]|nr:ABC transporter substrate-binding protein [Lachnospiraceae bacterium]
MKKILALLLAVTMISSLVVGCASNDDVVDVPSETTGETQPADSSEPVAEVVAPPENIRSNVASDTLVVAYGANPNGDFIDDFGNNAYDNSIKIILHNFMSTFGFQGDGSIVTNPTVVKEYTTSLDDEGNKTYTFELHNDLKWSDGSAITAADYVSEVLWRASPAWSEAGAASTLYLSLFGYSEYFSGENEYFAGIQLIDEFKFSATIDASELPYFYEASLVAIRPLCKAVYAPNVNIISDENGSRFDGDIMADAERIASTSGGERYAPTVTSGPYYFVSYENNNVTLRRNPHFKADMNGNVPTLEWVVQRTVPEETDIDMLLAGDVCLLPNQIEGEKIERARADEFMSTSSYLRNGFGNMPMMLDWGPTADVNVRWAIACLVDRTALLDQVLGGYGGLVDSYYGVSQWMAVLKERELREVLIPIAMNIDRANDYLDQSTWLFEEDGETPFDRTKANADGTYLRHNADGEPLVINHAAAAASIGNILELEFQKNTPLAGMKYNFDSPDFDIILNEYYYAYDLEDYERTYSTFSMGLTFALPFDPYFDMHSDWLGTWMNGAGMDDPEIDRLTMAMRRVEPGDNATYLDLWFDLMVRWNELMPMVPLYSNEYFNLFNASVISVNTTPILDWYYIICEIHKFQ